MKVILHIPTEQYGFVAIEADNLLPNEAEETYQAYSQAFKPQEGLTPKEMDSIIEKMCLGTSVEGGTELWSKATDSQKAQINCLKRALKRIEAKHSKREMYGFDDSGPGKGENGDYSNMD